MRSLFSLLMILISVPLVNAQNWTSWKADDVFHGIEVRERCTGYNEFAGRFIWDVQLRNRYQKSVDLTWAAEPQRLHGAQAQADQAFALAPGEAVEAHHTAPVDCSSGLVVRVNGVKPAANVPVSAPSASPLQPKLEGHWQSNDPEPLQKSLTVQVFGDAVRGQWSSPNFSFQVTTPLPKNLHGSISLAPGGQK